MQKKLKNKKKKYFKNPIIHNQPQKSKKCQKQSKKSENPKKS